jgi:hypothetical protein
MRRVVSMRGQMSKKPKRSVTLADVPEFGGHDAETGGHGGPKYAVEDFDVWMP